jgi:hypothetical protein
VFNREWTRIHANSRSEPMRGRFDGLGNRRTPLRNGPNTTEFPILFHDFIRVYLRPFAVQNCFPLTLKALLTT